MRVHIIEPAYKSYPEKEHTYPHWEGSIPSIGHTIWLSRVDVDYTVARVTWNPGDRPIVYIEVIPQERIPR